MYLAVVSMSASSVVFSAVVVLRSVDRYVHSARLMSRVAYVALVLPITVVLVELVNGIVLRLVVALLVAALVLTPAVFTSATGEKISGASSTEDICLIK